MCALRRSLRAGAELANRVPPQVRVRGRSLHCGDRAEVFRGRGVLQIQDPQSTGDQHGREAPRSWELEGSA